MLRPLVHRSLIAFRHVLGGGPLVGSVQTLGAAPLPLTRGVAFLAYAVRGHWRWDPAVFGAGTWFVAVHGPGRGERAR